MKSVQVRSFFWSLFSQGFILGPKIFLLYINDPSDGFISNIAIYADTTLYSKLDEASGFWKLLDLASELQRDTAGWGRKWLVDLNAGKTQIVSFDQYNNSGANDMNVNGSVLEDFLKLSFSSKSDSGCYIVTYYIAKTTSKKVGAFIRFLKFLSLKVALYLHKYTIQPCM